MEKGDIIIINYTATDKTNNKVFDSTDKEKAKTAGIFNEKIRYSPLSILVGNNELMKPLEEEIKKMKQGEEKEILLSPEKAFGERKSELIKVLPMKEFITRNIRPVPGLTVELNDARGRIQSVSGGRVRVDFNHELAGKEIEYKVKLEKVITEEKEKIESIKDKFFLGTNAKLKQEKTEIEVGFNLIIPQPQLKGGFVQTIFSNFEHIKKVRFVEEIEKKEDKKEPEKENKKAVEKDSKTEKKRKGKEKEENTKQEEK